MSKKSKGSSVKKSSNKQAAKPAKKVVAKKAITKKPAKPVLKKKVVAKKPAKAVKIKSSAKLILKKPAAKEKLVAKKPILKVKENKKEIIAKAVKPIIVKKVEAKPIKEAKPETPSKKAAEAKIESNEVMAISNTIPKPMVKTISASKIASISSSITNPVKRVDSYSIKSEKEPNGKYELEFVVRSSPEMLYEFLATPSGLSEWFCDDVNIRNGIYTFIWDGQLQQARLLKTHDYHFVRFQWVDKVDGSFFEFKIQKDDLTNDIALIITDFAETVSERESAKLLWQSQVEKLMHIIGSIF